MHISNNGLRLIENFEGWSAIPYWDAYGRVWTRGYGETEGIGPRSPALSRAQGQANLKRLVETRYEWAIRRLGVPLNQNEWDALCSFVWNLGPGILQGSLGDLLKAKDFEGFANAMLAYDHAGGVVLAGLKTRREQERALFVRAAPAADAYRPADEARWIREFDALHGKRGPWATVRRRALVRVMSARRKEIWRLANPHHWDVRNRYHRYIALRDRTSG